MASIRLGSGCSLPACFFGHTEKQGQRRMRAMSPATGKRPQSAQRGRGTPKDTTRDRENPQSKSASPGRTKTRGSPDETWCWLQNRNRTAPLLNSPKSPRHHRSAEESRLSLFEGIDGLPELEKLVG